LYIYYTISWDSGTCGFAKKDANVNTISTYEIILIDMTATLVEK